MKVCASCFKDEEIRQFINYSSIVDCCDCCGINSNVIDLNELSDFFIELLGLFKQDEKGVVLIDLIQKDWQIFTSNDCANVILSSIMSNNDLSFTECDKVSYLSEIQDCFSVWKELKFEVQERKRYFSDLETFNWEIYIRSNALIKKNTILYRSRITPDGKTRLKKDEMGAPPKEKATAGRANPLGIPYLYLCNQKETTYYEVRAVYLDRLSVGTFCVLKDLDIVDFSNEINLFYTYSDPESDVSLEDIVKRKILFDSISADLSKPLRRFDTEIEYVPTQLICEYCKQNGAEGIRFNSSLHKGGTNVVLFNSVDVKCTRVTSLEIKNVKIDSK